MVSTLNTYIPFSSAYSPNSVNIVLFFIRECDVDNCRRHNPRNMCAYTYAFYTYAFYIYICTLHIYTYTHKLSIRELMLQTTQLK